MSIERADKALAKSKDDLQKWRAKHAEAIAEKSRLESDVAVLDAPEKINEAAKERAYAITDAQSVIDYAVKGTAAAEDKERQAFRDLVKAYEAEETDRIKGLASDLAKLRKQLAGPLEKLRELTGVEYVPKPIRDRSNGVNVEPMTNERKLLDEMWQLATRRAMLRYWLDTGKIAKFVRLQIGGGNQFDGNPDANPVVVSDPGYGGGHVKQIPKDQRPDVLDRAPAPPPEPAISADAMASAPTW